MTLFQRNIQPDLVIALIMYVKFTINKVPWCQAQQTPDLSEDVLLGRKLLCYGDTSLLKEYSMQLGKIGSNLNQIAKHLNSGGSYFSVYSDVKEAMKELLDLKFKILPALEDVACGRKHRRKIEKDGEA